MLARQRDVRRMTPGEAIRFMWPMPALKSAVRERVAELEEAVRHDPQTTFHAILSTEAVLLSDMVSDEDAESIYLDRDMQDAVASSQRLFGEFELELERSFVKVFQRAASGRGYLEDRTNVTQSYLVRYRQLARREVELGKIGRDDRVAFVGAGPFPISAIEYTLSTGCKVEGLDINEAAVETGNTVIRALNLADRAVLRHAAGQDFDYAPYDVVIVDVLARPKAAIIREVAATAWQGACVLCRTTHGLRRFIYPPTQIEELQPYAPTAATIARGYQTLSTFRLRR